MLHKNKCGLEWRLVNPRDVCFRKRLKKEWKWRKCLLPPHSPNCWHFCWLFPRHFQSAFALWSVTVLGFSLVWKYVGQNAWGGVDVRIWSNSVWLSDESFIQIVCFYENTTKKCLDLSCKWFGISPLFDYILHAGAVHLVSQYSCISLEMY